MKLNTKSIDAPLQQRSLGVTPSSLDKEKGTVEAVFATNTPVRTWHWDIGEYHEVLSFDKKAVRMERLNTSAPLLDNHSRGRKIGTVEYGSLENGQLTGKVRFDLEDELGKREFRRFEQGFNKTFSVGYNVYNMRYIKDAEDGLPVYEVTDWEPLEMSTADIPADIQAGVRSRQNESLHKLTLEQKEIENTMETPEQAAERLKKEGEERTRIQNEARAAERTRVTEIRTLCTKHKMDSDFTDKHINDGSTLEVVRAAILEKTLGEEPVQIDGKAQTVVVKEGDVAKQRALYMSDAVMYRLNPDKNPLPAERKENPYTHKTLMDMCDEYLERNGLDTDGSTMARVKRAMNYGLSRFDQKRDVSMTTSDFPNLFANVLHKILRKEYMFDTGKWQPFCYEQPGFRINAVEKSIKLTDFNSFPQVKEGAEYKMQTNADTAENFMVTKYGSEFAITIEMIINDDLGGMERMGRKIALANSFTEDDIVWGLMKSGTSTLMSDGNAVFSNAHNNLASGAAMSINTLSALRLKIRTQTAQNGRPLDVEPTYIICGPSNEQTLNQILNPTLWPIQPSDAVPSYIKRMKPIITALITDNSYYVSVEPSVIDTIRYGGLVGEPGFTLEEKYEMRKDSWLWHARKYFGASFTDFRGMAFNPGS